MTVAATEKSGASLVTQNEESASTLILRVKNWAVSNSDLKGALLVGSYATGTARTGSDIDVVLLSDRRDQFLNDTTWINNFRATKKIVREDWGAVISLRAFYEYGIEVEFGLAHLSWASTDPTDSGTRQVIDGGAVILADPLGMLARLLRPCTSQNNLIC